MSDIEWERRPIEWYRFSGKVETGKGLCIFCNTVATHMRRQTDSSIWQALCEKHKDSVDAAP